MSDFKARLWKNEAVRYTKGSLVAYYCSGEDKIDEQAMCINLPDGGQIVIDTKSVIKLLKKQGRI